MKQYIFLFLTILISYAAIAQQTVTYMQYNLLNYGNFTSYCTITNNSQDDKDEYLRTILDHIRPDILAVNEVGRSSSNATRLLNGVLNDNNYGVTYKRADISNYASSYLINVFFYNPEKVEMESQSVAQTYIRDINHYRMYAVNENLNRGDTTYLNCFVTHLKAGYDHEDEEKRATMTKNLMNYIEWEELDEAILFSGDMNFYSHRENGVVNLMDHPDVNLRFYDPINKMGDWHNNSYYSAQHTQSTHTNSNGCASGGGMDDRFDFIFINNSIRNGLHGVQYMDYSYEAVGNDGEHFNRSLLDYPTNTSVPADVLNALYKNSDHLPVILDLVMETESGIADLTPAYPQVCVVNPVVNNIGISFYAREQNDYELHLLNLTGSIFASQRGTLSSGNTNLTLSKPAIKGLYLLEMRFGNGKVAVEKVVVQ